MQDKTQIEHVEPVMRLPSITDLFTDALMHRVNIEDKPWRGRGRHAQAARQRARAKRAKGRVVKGIRKASKRRPY